MSHSQNKPLSNLNRPSNAMMGWLPIEIHSHLHCQSSNSLPTFYPRYTYPNNFVNLFCCHQFSYQQPRLAKNLWVWILFTFCSTLTLSFCQELEQTVHYGVLVHKILHLCGSISWAVQIGKWNGKSLTTTTITNNYQYYLVLVVYNKKQEKKKKVTGQLTVTACYMCRRGHGSQSWVQVQAQVWVHVTSFGTGVQSGLNHYILHNCPLWHYNWKGAFYNYEHHFSKVWYGHYAKW